jgi:hypothetical protein
MWCLQGQFVQNDRSFRAASMFLQILCWKPRYDANGYRERYCRAHRLIDVGS